MDTDFISCGGCKNFCEDPIVLVCGCYCDDCVDKLLNSRDPNCDEFRCLFCDENHKVPSKGFKRYKSIANVGIKKPRLSLGDVYRGESVEELKSSLKEIKSKIDLMEYSLNHPVEIIQDYCAKQRNKIDLKVEELFKRINEIRDDLFKKINNFEKESLESVNKNEEKCQNVKDFLNETINFHYEWDKYLSNLKISEEKVIEAIKMAKIYENKIPVYENKSESVIFNGKFLELDNNYNETDTNILGNLNESLFDKIVIDQEDATHYKHIKKIYDFEYFDDNKILMTYESRRNEKYFVQIRNANLNQSVSKPFPMNSSAKKPYCVCTLGQYVILYCYESSRRFLVKFDKDLKELKKIKLKYQVKCLTSNENCIFILSKDKNCHLRVMDKDLNILHCLGQTESPNLPFYFPSQIKKILVRNKKFYCLYPNKVEMINQQSGDRLKVIDTNSKLIKTDINGNVYLLDRERSMIVIYDYNGDFLHQVELINLPKKFNFSIDNDYDSRCIINSNQISNTFVII